MPTTRRTFLAASGIASAGLWVPRAVWAMPRGAKTPAPATPPASASGSVPVAVHVGLAELARRWRKSERTLERWRLRGEGPPHLRIGGVLYRLEDVEGFEQTQLRQRATRRSRSRPGSASDEPPQTTQPCARSRPDT